MQDTLDSTVLISLHHTLTLQLLFVTGKIISEVILQSFAKNQNLYCIRVRLLLNQ